ncbi:hypothetical protein PAXRUDRAFT_735257 [Paxillus rubicundulus Ve08.2h10]|uniref:Uncharacterized protein n=1 Tax=Paxillus rubicundulus Ve08.2h10 TaxID=930991 RepID=A0A0D0CH20_9AGAM|nr:hypothetical protein PAXRUDRAFT_735257 [Paxillus rubicundulus Ve08.2h10]
MPRIWNVSAFMHFMEHHSFAQFIRGANFGNIDNTNNLNLGHSGEEIVNYAIRSSEIEHTQQMLCCGPHQRNTCRQCLCSIGQGNQPRITFVSISRPSHIGIVTDRGPV